MGPPLIASFLALRAFGRAKALRIVAVLQEAYAKHFRCPPPPLLCELLTRSTRLALRPIWGGVLGSDLLFSTGLEVSRCIDLMGLEPPLARADGRSSRGGHGFTAGPSSAPNSALAIATKIPGPPSCSLNSSDSATRVTAVWRY